MVRRKKDLRQLALDAAIDLAVSSGAVELTMDAVAARAGVSKGGMQYYFPTKASLLTAMVARVIELFEEDFRRASVALAKDSGQNLPLYIDRAFSGLGARTPTAKVVLAVYAHDASLLRPLNDYFEQRAQSLPDLYGPNVGEALTLLLMADGLWIFDALGASPFAQMQRQVARATAQRWAAEAKAKP